MLQATPASLEAILETIQQSLLQAVTNRHHAYHLMTVSNITADNTPSSRIVVMRDFNDQQRWVDFHTDVRSSKISQLEKNPHLSLLFYDPDGSKAQIGLQAKASIHHQDEITKTKWAKTLDMSKKCYLSPYAPGQTLPQVFTHDSKLDIHQLTDQQDAQAYEQFVVMRCHYTQIDFYQLNHQGNIHAKFSWDGTGNLTSNWLAP